MISSYVRSVAPYRAEVTSRSDAVLGIYYRFSVAGEWSMCLLAYCRSSSPRGWMDTGKKIDQRSRIWTKNILMQGRGGGSVCATVLLPPSWYLSVSRKKACNTI